LLEEIPTEAKSTTGKRIFQEIESHYVDQIDSTKKLFFTESYDLIDLFFKKNEKFLPQFNFPITHIANEKEALEW
jgi:hypothetical protein